MGRKEIESGGVRAQTGYRINRNSKEVSMTLYKIFKQADRVEQFAGGR